MYPCAKSEGFVVPDDGASLASQNLESEKLKVTLLSHRNAGEMACNTAFIAA